MYRSLKRKDKRVNYLSYGQNAPNYKDNDNDNDNDNKEVDESKLLAADNDISPLKLDVNNPQTESIIKSNEENEKPIVLKPKVNNKDNENDKISKPSKNKPLLCIENMLLLLIFAMLIYCLYVYINKSNGKSYFGARDCVSYDISRAYDIVK
tara:strand:+ start:12760 stop:13215 length:456 start_codon:yes stop_codon:yes gene_type:complete